MDDVTRPTASRSGETDGGGARRAYVPLRERPEWLSPRDLQEIFGIGRTHAWKICTSLTHVYLGPRSIRIHQSTLSEYLRRGGRI